MAANPPPATAQIFEASLGSLGRVVRGPAPITEVQAVAVRRANGHIVVCDGAEKENRALAQKIESQVGPYQQGPPHTYRAGPYALPHFQQAHPPPEGHAFYETAHRKAAKRP